MRTLIEDLYTNNVIFSYYGFIDNSVLTEVLQITKSKLESNNESPVVVNRITDAINECVQNIIKHNFFPDDVVLNYKSLLVVSKKENSYLIDAINVVNDTQKESINEQLSHLNTKTKEELLDLKTQSVVHGDKSLVAGSALIDLILKADACEYTFKKLDPNFLFNINFKINSLN